MGTWGLVGHLYCSDWFGGCSLHVRFDGVQASVGHGEGTTTFPLMQSERVKCRPKSAGAGASPALSERVDMYRSSAAARQELQERCKLHEKVRPLHS